MSVYSLTSETIDSYCRKLWEDLKDCGTAGMARAQGAVDALRVLGLLTEDQAELWRLRFDRCPGHENGDLGRVWCAYCGDICRRCGLAYGGAVRQCPDTDHCTGCCLLDALGLVDHHGED